MDSHALEMNDTLTTTSTSNLTPVSNGVEDEIIIRTVKLNKYFGDKHVLKDIDFEVRKREVVAVIGPSGSGKSTLIRCLNALEKATRSEEHTSELQSRLHLVCRLLLEKKNIPYTDSMITYCTIT